MYDQGALGSKLTRPITRQKILKYIYGWVFVIRVIEREREREERKNITERANTSSAA